MNIESRFRFISLDKLTLNKGNDRHGELPDEAASIRWMLENKGKEIRNLAEDIVSQGKVHERPLVKEAGETFVVFDGNRRITSLKLLNKPELAHDEIWKKVFSDIRTENIDRIPSNILCEIENDSDVIDDILYRRHTGSQAGVGQVTWGPSEKQNFIERTGKESGINFGREIEKHLKECGLISPETRIPVSNFNRLFSSDRLRARIGLAISDGAIKFTHDKEKVIDLVHRIVNDLCEKRLVLEGIWTNKDKNLYLDGLEKEHLLPNANDRLSAETIFSKDEVRKTISEVQINRPKKYVRKTLIRWDCKYTFGSDPALNRVKDIWKELQRDLTLESHPNAISVLTRVVLELGVNHFANSQPTLKISEDSLHEKIKKIARFMRDREIIDEGYFGILCQTERGNHLVSANTLHQYVHSAQIFPDPSDLVHLWDTLESFILLCLNVSKSDEARTAA